MAKGFAAFFFGICPVAEIGEGAFFSERKIERQNPAKEKVVFFWKEDDDFMQPGRVVL